MTQEQKQNMEDAIAAESTVVLIELSANHVEALKLTDSTNLRDKMALAAFNGILRGKVKAKLAKTLDAKFAAERTNQPEIVKVLAVRGERLVSLYEALNPDLL